MNFSYLHFLLYTIFSNSIAVCKSTASRDSVLLELSKTIKEAQTNIKEFKEVFDLTKAEVAKFKDLTKNFGHVNGDTHLRFTQLSEPANESKIRESLYVTQFKRTTPRARVTIDVKEDVENVLKNASSLPSFSEDPDDGYFEDELHRMEMEELTKTRIRSLKDQVTAMGKEIARLITPKDSAKARAPGEPAREDDSVARVVCEGAATT